MTGNLFRFVVALLAISYLITSNNATPVTRLERLIAHGPPVLPITTNNYPVLVTDKLVAKEKIWEEHTIDKRMIVELHDYPGTGANNRHVPRPQF
ncbi:hypothetical protein K2173_028167 [Erythroxylum novogranatense]|uniref:Uncharacterized protein n=1 Tax=Erythroxylum novogranatense TaxID=1862640 RepID=A0AAV8U188_9ROSI|nr:hypothetical protein K2173_028167 [Erythroxylum novogranatense]